DQVDEHRRGVDEEVEVGEVTAGGLPRTSPGCRFCKRDRTGGWRNTAGAEVFASLCQLFAGLRRADGPRVQQQGRPFEQVARVLLLAASVEHIAVFVADVSAR